MKKYRTDKLKVIEISTGLVIQVAKTDEDAKAIAKRLNNGCGFAGETPNFFAYVKHQGA